MKTKTGKLLLEKRSKNYQTISPQQFNQNIRQTVQYPKKQSNQINRIEKIDKQLKINYENQQNKSEFNKQPKQSQHLNRQKLKLYHLQSYSFNQHESKINDSRNVVKQSKQENNQIQDLQINNKKKLIDQYTQTNGLQLQVKEITNKIKKAQDFSQIQQLKNSLNNLQTQNYRLIEQNYILILYYKRLLKSNKQSLLRISNYMENLQYNQIVKEVFDSLSQNKQKLKQITQFNNTLMGDKRNLQKQFFKNYVEGKQDKLKIFNQTVNQFYLSHHQCQSTKISNKKDTNDRDLQQIKKQPKNRHSMMQKLNSQPFQLGHYSEYRSQNSIDKAYNFKSNVKILNGSNKYFVHHSECQQSFQYSNLDHIPDQISLNDNLPSHLNNSEQNINRYQVGKNQSRLKYQGSKNQLYNMLLLQASAIQHFCFNLN